MCATQRELSMSPLEVHYEMSSLTFEKTPGDLFRLNN